MERFGHFKSLNLYEFVIYFFILLLFLRWRRNMFFEILVTDFSDVFLTDIDVSYNLISVTLWIIDYDGDRFRILVAESLCWRLFSFVGKIFNVFNRSPISQKCHQHFWSLTSVGWTELWLYRSWYCKSTFRLQIRIPRLPNT